MPRLCLIPASFILLVGLAGSPAHARGAGSWIVLLAPRDRPAANRSLIRALRSQLSDVPVRLRVHPIASLPGARPQQRQLARSASRGAVAVVWHDLRAGRVCILRGGSGAERLTCRALGHAGEQGRYDAAALVVRTAVRARRPAAKPRRRSAAKPRRRRPARRRGAASPSRKWRATRNPPGSRRFWLALGANYGLDVFGPPDMPVAHGFRLSAELYVHRYGSVFLGYRIEPELKGEAETSVLKLQRHPIDAGVQARWRRGRWELGGRLTLRLIVTRARGVEEASEDDKRYTGLHFGLAAHVTGGFRLHPRVVIWLGLGASLFVLDESYPLENDAVFQPWLVQPSAMLGVTVDIF